MRHETCISVSRTHYEGDNTDNHMRAGSYAGTSNMLVSNIAFVNFTGYLDSTSGNRTAAVVCSTRNPCYNIDMRNITLEPTEGAAVEGAVGSCSYIESGGVHGMTGSGC